MPAHRSLAIVAALALGACAELSADAPLFSVADQTGAAPLTEGLWLGGSDECPFEQAATMERFPAPCAPFEVRRDADGAWLFVHRYDLAIGLGEDDRTWAQEHPGPLRMIIAPAVERRIADDAYAPVYLAEVDDEDDDGTRVKYLVLVPSGTMPATSVETFLSVSCDAALRDGPINGVTAHDETIAPDGTPVRDVRSCTATTQAGAREAVRRAIIEHLPTSDNGFRLVFIRPN